MNQFHSLNLEGEKKARKSFNHRHKFNLALRVEYNVKCKQKLVENINEMINLIFLFEHVHEIFKHIILYIGKHIRKFQLDAFRFRRFF